MKSKYEAVMNDGSPIEKLRAHIMSRGVAGIRTIAVYFRRLDENGDKKMDIDEFKEALSEYGISSSATEIQECFNDMDLDGTGKINFDEFLIALRPPLSDERKALIDQAFDKFDVDQDGHVTVEDLQGVYSAEYHPKFQSGEWTEEEVFKNWLDQFTAQSGDHEISREDFFDYYVGVSASIDEDDYFVEMMKSAWKLE